MKSIILDHKKSGKVSHVEGLNGEYTLCGLAIADSSINIEDFEWLRYEKERKPNCADCIKIITYCKNIPASSLSKSVKNCDY